MTGRADKPMHEKWDFISTFINLNTDIDETFLLVRRWPTRN